MIDHAQTSRRDRFLVATFTLTLVTSAALLFWLQPMISKFILPSVGGVPAVWNTAMLFFQAALLAGYVYAHLLGHYLRPKTQVLVHLSLLAVCLAWLPIGVDITIAPPTEGNPNWWVLSVLALGVGVPFLVVSGSAPILQNWFASSDNAHAESPYFLYAASNFGSMAALFGFPLVAEPLLDLNGQSLLWSAVFTALLVLTALSGRYVLTRSPARQTNTKHDRALADAHHRPSMRLRFLWLALVMTSTSLMLGITTHLTTDVAAVPLLWVVPLALYLLTFIIAFARRPMIGTNGTFRLLIGALAVFAVIWLFPVKSTSWVLWAVALVGVYFITVLACHTALAHIKPHKAWLTEFYLWIALGGVVGGAFNALAVPVLFDSVIEFALMMAVALALVLAERTRARGENPRIMLALVGVFFIVPISAEHFGLMNGDGVIARERNFFGVLKVHDQQDADIRVMTHGSTIHGVRDLTPGNALVPSGYYSATSPVADVFRTLSQRPNTGDIAAIGLGVGTITCHPTGGRKITFFEINPTVTRMAEDPELFAFMRGCGAKYDVIHGDGRLKIAQQPSGNFDLLFLDAFSSDSIPVHLITREAFEVYMDKIAPGGIVLVHISNQHLDLAPVLAAIARDLGLSAIERTGTLEEADVRSPLLVFKAQMVALARDQADLQALRGLRGWRALDTQNAGRTWTDSYTNVVGALKVLRHWTAE